MTAPCHVPNCGRRCPTCGERITCLGPEPVAVACATHDDECQSCNDDHGCPECRVARMAARAEAAWDAEPDRTWEDPRRQGDIDMAAENRKTEREYAHHLLMDREEWA